MPEASGLWWWEDAAALSASQRKVIASFIIVAGFLLSILLIGGLSQSKIGLTDENDLPQYVGKSGHVAMSQVPRLLMEKTEIGAFGESQRFRPVYYLTRLIETSLWGLNGGYWYSWRIAMFGIVVAAMLWLYTQCVGLVLGAIFTVFTVSFSMWVDIWTRSTGPSEQYAAFGTAIYAIATWHFVKRWRSGQRLNASSIAMAAGAIIAMGSKENMLILELPLFATLVAGLWKRRLTGVGIFALMLAMAFGVWIASSIAVYFVGTKVEDIYGNSVHLSLLRTRGMVLVYIYALIAAAGILVAGAVFLVIGDREKIARYRLSTRKYGFYACIAAGIFVFNVIFYTGQVPSGGRYDFPAVLAVPALLIILFFSLSDTATLFGFGVIAKKVLGVILVLGLTIYTVRAPWALTSAVKTNIANASAFNAGMEEAQRMTGEHPQWPIFIKSFNYLDYEPVQALAFFFIAKNIENPRYLVYVANAYDEVRTPFQAGLDQSLSIQSSKGMAERGYLPLAQAALISDGRCFVIVLRKPEQFMIDQSNGKDPAIGKDCRLISISIYWEGPQLRFVAPGQ